MSAANKSTTRLLVATPPTPRLMVVKAEQVPWTGGSVGHDAPTTALGHIGTTSSGRGILGPAKEHVQAAARMHGPEQAIGASGVRQGMGTIGAHAQNHVGLHDGFTPKDHHEAASFHTKLAQQHVGTPRGIAHNSIAQAHTQAAQSSTMGAGIGKSLWVRVPSYPILYVTR